MRFITKFIMFIAMSLMGIVSMWTTHESLRDSILPTPAIQVPIGHFFTWNVSVFALMLSVAIGLMLFALKVAIMDDQKKLGFLGLIGLFVVGFISISFNLDILYRTADREFFIRYSTDEMREKYEQYLAQVEAKLIQQRENLLRPVARQEGELESEIKGLRKAPAGYGDNARQEDYRLTVLQKETEVQLKSIEEGLAAKRQADVVLAGAVPNTLEEIHKLQSDLRVSARQAGSIAGIPLPPAVKTDSPLFTVFSKIFEFRSIGIKEIFFIMIAFFIDLGDIIGYSLVPNQARRKKEDKAPEQPKRRGILLGAPAQQRLLAESQTAGESPALPPAEEGNSIAEPERPAEAMPGLPKTSEAQA